jgi:hypothetical protein
MRMLRIAFLSVALMGMAVAACGGSKKPAANPDNSTMNNAGGTGGTGGGTGTGTGTGGSGTGGMDNPCHGKMDSKDPCSM